MSAEHMLFRRCDNVNCPDSTPGRAVRLTVSQDRMPWSRLLDTLETCVDMLLQYEMQCALTSAMVALAACAYGSP